MSTSGIRETKAAFSQRLQREGGNDRAACYHAYEGAVKQRFIKRGTPLEDDELYFKCCRQFPPLPYPIANYGEVVTDFMDKESAAALKSKNSQFKEQEIWVQAVKWVGENFGVGGIVREDAPSTVAWGLWMWISNHPDNRNQFWTKIWSKVVSENHKAQKADSMTGPLIRREKIKATHDEYSDRENEVLIDELLGASDQDVNAFLPPDREGPASEPDEEEILPGEGQDESELS